MGKRRRIVRRSGSASKPAVSDQDLEEEEDLEVEGEEPEDEYDEEDLEVEDLEEEDEDEEEEEIPVRKSKTVAPPAKPASKKPAPAKPAVKKPAKPVDEDEDEDEETPAPAKVTIKKIDQQMAELTLTGLLEAMDDGNSLLITKLETGKWQISTTDAKVVGRGFKRGRDYDMEVEDPKFHEWRDEWRALSFEEKKKRAKKAGATWEPHDNPQIEVIRMAEAYRAKLGIHKYKPEYRTYAARAAVRAGK